MSDDKKIIINYEVGVEYYVPSKYAPVDEQLRYNKKNGTVTPPYVPDIQTGDLVRWAVPQGKGKRYEGIPMKVEVVTDGWTEYVTQRLNILQYEDVALVLEKRMIVDYFVPELHLRLLTNHGIGWVPAKFLTRVNKR